MRRPAIASGIVAVVMLAGARMPAGDAGAGTTAGDAGAGTAAVQLADTTAGEPGDTLPVAQPLDGSPAADSGAADTGAGLPAAEPTGAQPAPGDRFPADHHLIENGVEWLRITPGTETFRDGFSGYYFPVTITVRAVDGSVVHMRATGSGGRKKFVFKIYGAAFYVDDSAYLGPDPLKTLVTEDLARRMVMRFKRDASPDRVHDVFQEAIENLFDGHPGPDVVPDINRLLGYFEGGLRKGEAIEFTYLPGKGLYTSVAGVAKPVITNPGVARRIWEVWLGDRPLSPALRLDLVRFVVDESRDSPAPDDAGH